MAPMALGPPVNLPADAAGLVEHVLERYHEAHRRELPAIVRMARELESGGASPALADDIDAMARALEMHMFKEEMRLFPMMEQGGNTLIAHLIDDMQAEHEAHTLAVAGIRRRLADLTPPPGAESGAGALRQALERLFDDLEAHMQVEDEVLFPMFVDRRRVQPREVGRP